MKRTTFRVPRTGGSKGDHGLYPESTAADDPDCQRSLRPLPGNTFPLRSGPVQGSSARSIVPRLKYLCAAEKITCSDAAVRSIAESAEGDIRSAVNMLYASAIGRDRLEDFQVHTSQKDERVSIFSLITAIFHTTPDDELMRLSYDVDDTPETIEQWVEGSVHLIPHQQRCRGIPPPVTGR